MEVGGQMKTIKKIATVLLSAALCSATTITFTWMMPTEVQLLGMAVAFVWLVRVFWKDYRYDQRII